MATSGIGRSGREDGGVRLTNAILIAGPTASGKSALAIAVARRTGGVIVNADSMQVYAVLHALTARPGIADLAAAPHQLYGHVMPTVAHSTGAWLRDVAGLASRGLFDARPAIFVGGTGLYFRALTQGLSEMPDIPQSIRDRWRYHLLEDGPARLHRLLTREDPRAAQLLKPGDGQRLVRALEVLEASGRSILDWQAERQPPLVDPVTARRCILDPDRAVLGQRIERRFAALLGRGALDEARAMGALVKDPALPSTKAIGLRELQSVIAGERMMDQAVEQAVVATRQYAKRQSTWFRNQCGPEWLRSPGVDPAALAAIIAP